MSAFIIKMIAITAMVIDHIGFFLVPQEMLFRAVGRLAFPLFAWLVANGAKHTKNIDAYLTRLFVFALLSQIPYTLAHRSIGIQTCQLNVFFTLFLGLLSIKFIMAKKNRILTALVVLLCGATAQYIESDYGLMGILSIVFFYMFFDDFKMLMLAQIAVYIGVLYSLIALKLYDLNILTLIQPLALFSLFFVYNYNKKPGPKAKYLFYVFYPLQFLVFYLIVRYISGN